MARESFEDPEVAEFLNKNFVSIKVDREERPDIDHIYMSVCQAMTGRGGWPLTILMTPEKKPFYSGTYFPKYDRMGMPGLLTLLDKVIKAWNESRESLIKSAGRITDLIGNQNTSGEIDPDILFLKAYTGFKNSFDSVYGGFGNAPKFPAPHNLYFLLRYWFAHKDKYALEMVEKTIDSMYRGGIFDHISGGFCRYSTDEKWLVPHFEKMLYDNALLAIVYLEAYQATKCAKYTDVARQILTYVLRDMTSPGGGFYSAEDADSEGKEGKFYLWSVNEVKQVLGGIDGNKYCDYYNITQAGNFEGMNIPNLIESTIPEEERKFIENCRQKLFEYRGKRVHPYMDDKILTSWNGLMIAAMAVGGRILGIKEYTDAAKKAVDFIFSKLVRRDGRLMARYRDGETAYPAYIDDYAFLIWGLIELYETTYIPEYLFSALDFNSSMLEHFWDYRDGGLFIYGNDSEQLIVRPKDAYDGAIPSGNSVAALNFLRLARLTGDSKLEDMAGQQFKAFGKSMESVPGGFSFMLSALLFAQSGAREIIISSGLDRQNAHKMLDTVREGFMPFTVSAFYSDEHKHLKKSIPFVENYIPVNGKATAYVCENFSCSYPVTDAMELENMLQ
jgi:uncharacterized protein